MRPPSRSNAPKASAYEVTTHARSPSVMPRSAWASGKAIETIVLSRTTMS